MQTSVISYRVADFLKQHPPFQFMDEADLIQLAAHGRVKFHESDEYLIWQGASHGVNIFVIQQGTVSLWEERTGDNGEADVLRDIRGAGDLLGIDRFAGAEKSLLSAKSTSDVVVYAFPSSEFAALVAKYPAAEEYVAAAVASGRDYEPAEQRQAAEAVFLYDVVRGKTRETVRASASIRKAIASLRASGLGAVGVVNENKQFAGILTTDRVLQWIEDGETDASIPVAGLLAPAVCSVAPDAPVSECVLTMASSEAPAAAILERTPTGDRFHGIVTQADLALVFGEQPVSLLGEIRSSADFTALRDCNHRVRTFLAGNLQSTASVDWLARFAHAADVQLIQRVLHLTGAAANPATDCWCFTGAAGRSELLTQADPGLALIYEGDESEARGRFDSVHSALTQCGYLPLVAQNQSGTCASIEEWETRFAGWLNDPIENDIFLARPYFDLHHVSGNKALFDRLNKSVSAGITKTFLYLLANDCLSNLPPLTFFRDAVVHGSGEQSDVFDLQRTALEPLVDVGRVFGIAAGHAFGSSTLQRFAWAKSLLPENESIFREASETLRAVLFHQARVGIRQKTDGSELPPSLLSRHDRQVLKNGFRSILKLLEFTAECEWLEKI